MTDLVPGARYRTPEHSSGDNPLLTLHRQMDRLLDDTFRSFGLSAYGAEISAWPSIEMSNTDREVKITADLPGLDEKDIDLSIENNVLTLRGEKRSEIEDMERHYSERYLRALRAARGFAGGSRRNACAGDV